MQMTLPTWFVTTLVAAFTSTTFAQAQGKIEIPAAIKPAAGLNTYLEAPAIGVQIYTCGKMESGAFGWIFKAPEAQLFDTQNKLIGKHYAGPTWEGLAGEKVVGAVKANMPAPDRNSTPWLLLDITSSAGPGLLTQAKGILRVSTTGGLPAGQTCGEAQSGTEFRVPYTATYLFLK